MTFLTFMMSLCSCIIILTLLPLINGQTAPEVVMQDSIVVLGDTAAIICSYTLSGTRGFFSSVWYEYDSTLSDGRGNFLVNSRGTNPDGRYSVNITQVTAQTGVSTLTIANTVMTDDDSYLCTIIDDFGENGGDYAKLNVYYIGGVMIDISSTTDPYFTITCSVDGNPVPQLDLYHNNTIIMTKTSMNLTHTRSTVTEDDNGEYYCKASNTVGTETSNIITLDYYISDVTFEISSTQEPSFTMTCSGNSNPVPQLNLYHNGTIIKRDTTSLTYTRNQVSEDVDGEYYCKANSNIGTVTSNIIILDYYKPEFELPEYMIVEFGEDVVISIDNMSANPSDVTYQWTIDDPNISDTDTNPATFSFTASDDVKPTYVISVNVSNVIGSKKDSITITVSAFNCSSASGLTVGMVFVGIIIGAFGVIAGQIGYTKIKQNKLTENKGERKAEKKKQETSYMEYMNPGGMNEPSSQTYQDLQHGVQEESAYVNVKTKNTKT